MPGSLLGVRCEIGEQPMDHPAFLRRRTRVDRRREERVREPDQSGPGVDDAGALGCGKGMGGSLTRPGCGGDQIRRRLGGCRGDQEGLARVGRKDIDPRPEERLEVSGNGKGRSRPHPPVAERPRDLEREEGIAVRMPRGCGAGVAAATNDPSRVRNSAWSAPMLSGPRAMRSDRSGDSARSTPRVTGPLPSDRKATTSPTGSDRSRRTANVSAAAVGRSSHWASSTTSRTRPVRDRSRRRVRKAVETAPWSSGASGSSRSRATARARRCGAGIVSAVSSYASSSRSRSPAKDSLDSCSPGPQRSTAMDRFLAASTSTSTKVLFPMPATPSMTSARGHAWASETNRSAHSSSPSRPTIRSTS